MNSGNPLLADTVLPAFSTIRPEHVVPAIDAVLSDYRARVDALLADPAPRTFARVMLLQEALEDRLERAWSPVSHLHSVRDSEELRAVHGQALERITEHASELGQNRALYAAVRGVAENADYSTLPRAARMLVEHAMRDFRLSGVALEEPARTRFKQIANELARLGTEFEEAVLDATEAWSEQVAQAAALSGIPALELALLQRDAAAAGREGFLITLKQPSVQAVLTYADDRALRERVYAAYHTRASDQGPHAGRFDNSARIEQILTLRHEAARLLGFANAAEESLAVKMAATPERVLEFLRDLARRARPVAERELLQLREFAARELHLSELQPWDIAYASEKLRVCLFELSEEELKPYFALPTVLDGTFALAARLFGICLRERMDVEVWHPQVRYFDVLDAAGNVIAGMFVDLYARAGKRSGAWMDVCRARFRNGARLQLPVAYLTCNFPAPAPPQPALLTHDDVLTLLHEFGHGLHLLLTEVDYPGVSGFSGVEWDAIELPSQFMENFGWRREALDLLARHWQSAAPLPEDLYRRMLAARYFHAGLMLVRQVEYALFDFRLHLEFDPARGARSASLLDEIRSEVAVLRPPPWQRMAHSFTHIFSGGYAAGYYSYLWAEVLSADAFGRFEQDGVFDPAAGHAFRRSILAVGGSRPALESFIEFRGREPTPQALLRSYGLVTHDRGDT